MAKSVSKKGIIRWKGFGVLGLFLFGFGIYFLLLLDWHLKSLIEKYATYVNAAPVKIAKIKTNFIKSTFRLDGLQVGNPSNPDRNFFEIDRIEFNFGYEALLRRKMNISNLESSGLRYDTARPKNYGEREDEYLPELNQTGLIERVAQGFFADVRGQIGENPLRHLSALVHGFDLATRVVGNLKDLASYQKAVELRKQMRETSKQWPEITQSLPKLPFLADSRKRIDSSLEIQRNLSSEGLEEKIEQGQMLRDVLQAERARVQVLYHDLNDRRNTLSADFSTVNELVEKDIQVLKGRLNLPRLGADDLTSLLLGPQILNYLERVTYYIDLSRRKMSKGERQGRRTSSIQDRFNGITIDFGKTAAYPKFLLQHASLESGQEAGPGNRIVGVLESVTSDPPLYGRPMNFDLSATLPKQQIEGFVLHTTIDHTGQRDRETIKITAKSIPVKHASLTDGGELNFGIEKGNLELQTEINFTDNELLASFDAKFTDVTYFLTSGLKELEETVRKITDPLTSFHLKGKLEGSFDKMTFVSHSELGVALAKGLRSVFHFQIAALEDDLRKEILDAVHPIRTEGERQLSDLEDRYLAQVEASLASLQNLEKYADKAVAQLSEKTKRHGRAPTALRSSKRSQ